MAKRMQTQKKLPPVICLGDLPLWINAKLGQLLFKILLTVVGFFGFVFAMNIENANAFNSFLVGYSLDSVIELFGNTLEQRAAKQVEILTKQLTPTETG